MSAPDLYEGPVMAPEKVTVEQWVDRYYKADRLNGEPGRRERIIANREADMRAYGSALISRHESVTGEAVTLHDHEAVAP